MLNKANRLVTDFEHKITRKYGTLYTTGIFNMYVLNAKNYQGPPKIGLVISNKFSKKAVIRNRIKRLYRECIRHNIGIINNNYWILIYPRHLSLDKTYENICSEVNKTLQKIFITN